MSRSIGIRSHKKLIMTKIQLCYNLKISHGKVCIKRNVGLRMINFIVKTIENYILSLLFDH